MPDNRAPGAHPELLMRHVPPENWIIAIDTARRFMKDYPQRPGGQSHGVIYTFTGGCPSLHIYWTPTRAVVVRGSTQEEG